MKQSHLGILFLLGAAFAAVSSFVSLPIALVLLTLTLMLLTIDKWMDKIIYVPVFYIFVDYLIRKISIFGPISTIWDDLLLLGMFVLLFYRRYKSEGKLRYEFTPMDLSVLIFILFGVSHVLIVAPDLSIAIEGFRAVFQQVFWYFIITQFIQTPKQAKKAMNIIALMGLMLGIHATYQYVAGVQMPGNWIDSSESIRTRAFSIVGSPNILGVIFVLFMPIVLGLVLSAKQIALKVFYGLSLMFMTFGLVFTLSRGSWLAFGFSMLVFALFINRKIIIHLGALVGIFIVSGSGFSQRLLFMFSPTYMLKSAAGGRIMRWMAGIDKWSESPIFGVGLGRYGGAVAMNNKLAPFYVDNYYLKTLVEMGIYGIVAFILMIVSFIHFGIKTIKYQTTSQTRLLTIGLYTGCVGVLVQNCVENIFEVPAMVFYFWLTVALLNAFRPKECV